MSSLWLEIGAVDSLMFRDGRPFNQNDAGASVASSVFPPYPPTVVGVVRATMWRQLGGTPGDWDREKLGDGTNWQSKENILGKLRFGAPLLLKGGEPVFPVPLNILEGKISEESNKKKVTRLLLDEGQKFKSDLGDRLLPVPADRNLSGLKNIVDRWITKRGMEQILKGGVPDDKELVGCEDLWSVEPRVGIGISHETRVVNDAQLYMASHVRMADDVSLCVGVDGCSIDIGSGGVLMPFAGEHRMAEIKSMKDVISRPEVEDVSSGGGRCFVVALSPVVPDVNGNIKGLDDAKIVSACVGKAVSIGGWDTQEKRPLPLRQCYPSGSVWFLEDCADIAGIQDVGIGQATEWGFGQVLIGKC